MSRPVVIPDLPATRPRFVEDARGLVARIYHENKWGEWEQASHQRSLGLEPKPTAGLTHEDLKAIVTDFEESRMVIFAK